LGAYSRDEALNFDLADHFVGRGAQLAQLDSELEGLSTGRAGAVQVVGEAGIGKTRLLAEFAARADARGYIVLRGAGADLDRDLAFWVFVDALDDYVESVEPRRLRLENLDEDVRTELAHVFPSLTTLAVQPAPGFQDARHRTNRAIRALLERLAATKPLVLVLDDFHWADAASVDLVASLLHRPPSAPVLIVLAARPHQVSPRLQTALERALRDRDVTRISLGPLTASEAGELLSRDDQDPRMRALYEESGGNPFYLEQLVRAPRAAMVPPANGHVTLAGVQVPPLVAAALIEELALLSTSSRLVLQGASVAGDPFEPELAAAAADVGEQVVMDAIDELLRQDLIRSTDVPRRFRFRHPIVRRALYETTPAGWRIGAHERADDALARRGATAVTRAHHVERSARIGNLDAVATLTAAGDQTAQRAPAAATRWFAAALRLLPDTAETAQRVGLLLRSATALGVIGRFDDARAALLESLAIVSQDSIDVRLRLSTTCARVEHLMGAHERAQARLEAALHDVVDQASPEAVALMMELAMGSVHRMDYPSMQTWGDRAASAGRQLDDPALKAASVAALARAGAFSGATPSIIQACDEAAALVDALSDEDLARRLDAATHLAGAETYLQRFADAQRHAERAMAVGLATGQDQFFPQLLGTLGSVWSVRGQLTEAVEPLDGAIEAARMTGNPHTVAWALFARSMVALQAGDVELARATAQESSDLAADGRRSHLSAWAAVALAGALLHSGEPRRAAKVLVASAGGEELPLTTPNWRTHSLDLLTRCLLATDRPDAARNAAHCAQQDSITLPLPRALADRALAAVALNDGDAVIAAQLALRSADVLEALDAPIEAAVSRMLAGRALAQAGDREHAIIQLERAAADLDRVGAIRFRGACERELRKLGQHIHRRTRPGAADQTGVASLTEREQQIADLIVDRKTNAEIASELFLSKKTIETHVRNMFRKLDATSRAEIARAVEQADRVALPASGGRRQ
jgi:DNA-binding NarL/FixJ family response regulator/tetratricopeptide (TPR) repeat protein